MVRRIHELTRVSASGAMAVRTSLGFLATVFLAANCNYSPTIKDCEVQCNASTGCPSGFSCSAAESLCRPAGVEATCAALGDGRVNNTIDSRINGVTDSRLNGEIDGGSDGAGIDALAVSFTPSNLDSSADDLHAGTTDLVLAGEATIDTDAGTITDTVLGSGVTRQQVQAGSAPSITVFRFRSVTITGNVTVTGTSALAIVAASTMTISGTVTKTSNFFHMIT